MRNVFLGIASFAGLALIALASRTSSGIEVADQWTTHRAIRTRTGEPARLTESTYFDIHGDAAGSIGEYFMRSDEVAEKLQRDEAIRDGREGDYSAPSMRVAQR